MIPKSKTWLLIALLVIAVVPLAAIPIVGLGALAKPIGSALTSLFLLPLVGMARGLADYSLQVTKALPNGAATVVTDGIDLEVSAQANTVAQFELRVAAPALVTADLPDTETMKYDVYHDTASDFSTEALLLRDVIVQTGAGGAGAAAQTVGVRLPAHVSRYVRLKATNSGAGDASDKSMTVDLVVPHA